MRIPVVHPTHVDMMQVIVRARNSTTMAQASTGPEVQGLQGAGEQA